MSKDKIVFEFTKYNMFLFDPEGFWLKQEGQSLLYIINTVQQITAVGVESRRQGKTNFADPAPVAVHTYLRNIRSFPIIVCVFPVQRSFHYQVQVFCQNQIKRKFCG